MQLVDRSVARLRNGARVSAGLPSFMGSDYSGRIESPLIVLRVFHNPRPFRPRYNPALYRHALLSSQQHYYPLPPLPWLDIRLAGVALPLRVEGVRLLEILTWRPEQALQLWQHPKQRGEKPQTT